MSNQPRTQPQTQESEVVFDLDQAQPLRILNWTCPHCKFVENLATAVEILPNRPTCKCRSCGAIHENPLRPATFRSFRMAKYVDGSDSKIVVYAESKHHVVSLMAFLIRTEPAQSRVLTTKYVIEEL